MNWLKYLANPRRYESIVPYLDIDLERLSLWNVSTNAGGFCEVTLFHLGFPASAPDKWKKKNYDGLNLIFGFNFESLVLAMPNGLYGNNPVLIEISEKRFKILSKDSTKAFSVEAVYFGLTLDLKPNEPL